MDEVLHNLDPKDLSFNNMFGDKMRLVIPLKEKDPLKDLTEFLEENGYEPDYTTGLATYYTITLPGKEGERPTTMIMNRAQKRGAIVIDKEGEVYKSGIPPILMKHMNQEKK